jgi:hypothetical protein
MSNTTVSAGVRCIDELYRWGASLRDRQERPDHRKEYSDSTRFALELDKGFQAPVVLGEGASREEAERDALQRWTAPEPRQPSYEELETTAQTWRHIDLVRKFLRVAAVELLKRGETHDRSKFDRAEVDVFTEFTPKLKGVTYGSDEYKRFLVQMKPALDHHYAHNAHHPEFRHDGVNGMNLFDVVEMFVDWLASTRRHADGDIYRSITVNQARFQISDQLAAIFRNTARDFPTEG